MPIYIYSCYCIRIFTFYLQIACNLFSNMNGFSPKQSDSSLKSYNDRTYTSDQCKVICIEEVCVII